MLESPSQTRRWNYSRKSNYLSTLEWPPGLWNPGCTQELPYIKIRRSVRFDLPDVMRALKTQHGRNMGLHGAFVHRSTNAIEHPWNSRRIFKSEFILLGTSKEEGIHLYFINLDKDSELVEKDTMSIPYIRTELTEWTGKPIYSQSLFWIPS